MAKYIRTEEGVLLRPSEIDAVYMRPMFQTTDEYGEILSESGPYIAVAVMNNGDEHYLDEDMSIDEAVAFVEEARS